MKNIFLIHLDKINFILILTLFAFQFADFSFLKNQSSNNLTANTSPSENNTQQTTIEPPKIQTANMRNLVQKGFRPDFSIIEVNGRKFEDKQNALTTVVTHNLYQGDLNIVFLDDKNTRKNINLSLKDVK